MGYDLHWKNLRHCLKKKKIREGGICRAGRIEGVSKTRSGITKGGREVKKQGGVGNSILNFGYCIRSQWEVTAERLPEKGHGK